jgi:hypothetical protein
MYDILVHVHSILRWVVVLSGGFTVVRYSAGLTGGRSFQKLDNTVAAIFIGSLHAQLLLGLYLYFSSQPWTMFGGDMKQIMRDTTARFKTVEHITGMLIAIVIAQVGRTLSKKADTDAAKFKKGLIWMGLAFAILMLTIPWPFREALGGHWF